MAKYHEVAIPDSTDRINRHTFRIKERLWMNSLAVNLPVIRDGSDVKELPKGKGKPALVIGAGPSINKYRQLRLISKSDFKGHIIVCDKILKPALRKRIVPEYVVCTDGTPGIAKFFPKYKKNETTRAIFNALTVHPNTVEACRYPISWYLSMIDDPREEKSVTRAVHYMTKKTMLVSMGNVGGMSWHLAYYLGYNPIALVGLDYGYPSSTHIEKTVYYRAYLKLVKGNKDLVKSFFEVIKNPDTGREVLLDMNFNAYRNIFLPYAESAKCKTINCSPESSIFGEGVTYQSLEEFLHENS